MKKVKKILKRVKFYADASKCGLPFIKIDWMGYKNMIMLVDTGSNNNILFDFAYRQIKDLLKPVEGSSTLYGIDGKEVELKLTDARLPICGKEYDMRFLVREDDDAATMLSKEVGFPVCGIIGTYFMIEYGWMIDFCKQEIIIPEYKVRLSDLEAVRMWNKMKRQAI